MANGSNDQKAGLAGRRNFFLENKKGSVSHHMDSALIDDLVRLETLRISMDRLAEDLSGKADPNDKIACTRSNVVALLDRLKGCLREILASPISHVDSLVVQIDHPGIILLEELIGALKDLDNAKNVPLFEKPKISKANSLASEEIRRRDALLMLVDMIEHRDGLTSRAAAERAVSQRLSKAMGRDKAPSPNQIKEMRKTRRKKQKKSS